MELDVKLTKSGVPIYLQLKEQIKIGIVTGKLKSGTQMPTVRQLAVQLEINANTVSRVYSQLEAEGYLLGQQGRGTFVTNKAQELLIDKSISELQFEQLLEKFLLEAHKLGYSLQEIIDYLTNKHKEGGGEVGEQKGGK